jgi:hypothetical protein
MPEYLYLLQKQLISEQQTLSGIKKDITYIILSKKS